MTDNVERQARLLEDYLDQLAREPERAAPDELDPEIADLTHALRTRLTPPEPAPAFVDELAATLATEARARAGAAKRAPARTSIEERPLNGRDIEQFAPPTIADDRAPQLIAPRPGSWRRELLGIAAAIVVLVLVAGLLAALFDLHVNSSNNGVPAAQPTPTERSVAPPATVAPTPSPTPAPTVTPSPTPEPTPTPTPTPTASAEATVSPLPSGWKTTSDVTNSVVISHPPEWDVVQGNQAGSAMALTSWKMPETGGGGIPDGGIKIDFGPLPYPMPSFVGATYTPGVDGHPAIFFVDESLTIASPGSPPPQSSFGGAPHDLIIFYQVGNQAWEFAALSTEPLDDGSPARTLVDQIVSTIHYEP